MVSMFSQILAVAVRVLRQLQHDRRFLALSIIAPLAVVYMLYLFFDAVDRPFFNPNDFVPPVAAFLVHFLTYMLCAVGLVRERTQHTLIRMFVSGYQRGSIIGGYMLAFSVLATVQSLLVIIELQLLFHLDYEWQRFLALWLVIWMLALVSIALGIFVSNFARNEGQVLPMIPLVLVPSVFLSGLIVPAKDLPNWINWVSYITPTYYANNAIQALKESTADYSLLLYLFIYGAVLLALSVFTLREEN
jgi:ABC-2 type transport system permease protein